MEKNIDRNFELNKRTIRVLTASDVEVVGGGITAGQVGVIALTVATVAATILSSIECTPLDAAAAAA
jgi:hypothetical protein